MTFIKAAHTAQLLSLLGIVAIAGTAGNPAPAKAAAAAQSAQCTQNPVYVTSKRSLAQAEGYIARRNYAPAVAILNKAIRDLGSPKSDGWNDDTSMYLLRADYAHQEGEVELEAKIKQGVLSTRIGILESNKNCR